MIDFYLLYIENNYCINNTRKFWFENSLKIDLNRFNEVWFKFGLTSFKLGFSEKIQFFFLGSARAKVN